MQTQKEVRYEKIQKRAYEIYLNRDPYSGTPEEDWRKAEAEIAEREKPASMQASTMEIPLPNKAWREPITK
jgi:hypothetical protein